MQNVLTDGKQSPLVHLRSDLFESLVDLRELASAERYVRGSDDGYIFRFKSNTRESFFVFGVCNDEEGAAIELGRILWAAYQRWCEENRPCQ